MRGPVDGKHPARQPPPAGRPTATEAMGQSPVRGTHHEVTRGRMTWCDVARRWVRRLLAALLIRAVPAARVAYNL